MGKMIDTLIGLFSPSKCKDLSLKEATDRIKRSDEILEEIIVDLNGCKTWFLEINREQEEPDECL